MLSSSLCFSSFPYSRSLAAEWTACPPRRCCSLARLLDSGLEERGERRRVSAFGDGHRGLLAWSLPPHFRVVSSSLSTKGAHAGTVAPPACSIRPFLSAWLHASHAESREQARALSRLTAARAPPLSAIAGDDEPLDGVSHEPAVGEQRLGALRRFTWCPRSIKCHGGLADTTPSPLCHLSRRA